MNSIFSAPEASLKIVVLVLLVFALLPIHAYALDLERIFAVEGDTATEDLGYYVQSPGDLDGDGFSEVIVGSFGPRSTKAYNGGNPASTVPLTTYDGYPHMNSWIDDINGDYYPELAIYISIPNETKQYDIYYGSPTIYQKTEPDITIYANLLEGFDGIAVEDYDADGNNELITSADFPEFWPHESIFYIYEIGPDLDSIADDTLILRYHGVVSAYADECVGDLNGDDYADYVISSYGNADPPYILIYFGGEDIDSVPDIQFFSPFIDGPGYGYFGLEIEPTGDINKDGYNDFIVTSTSGPPCIFYGGNPFNPTPTILEFKGKTANRCGDINHDGWEDIAVGFTGYGVGSGIVYVYYGAYHMDTIADIIIPYNEVPEYPYAFGKSVGPAGDFNGDGVDDLAVGADESSDPNWNNGYLFVFAGSDSLPTPAEEEPDIPVPVNHDILEQNYPNPFNNRTIIEYYLHGISEREIEIDIYNMLGQKVRTLYNGIQSGRSHSIYWDGRDDYDNDVPSGIYFYQLQSGDEVISKKMLYLK